MIYLKRRYKVWEKQSKGSVIKIKTENCWKEVKNYFLIFFHIRNSMGTDSQKMIMFNYAQKKLQLIKR